MCSIISDTMENYYQNYLAYLFNVLSQLQHVQTCRKLQWAKVLGYQNRTFSTCLG